SEGAGKPAEPRSVIAQSSGQGGFPVDVIIAITECPAGVLNPVAAERTSAGRFLIASRSVNGNGTRTTMKRSKITIRILVRAAVPFGERPLHGTQILQVEWKDPTHGRRTV